MSEFRNATGDILRLELSPGYLAVFEDVNVQHRVTSITPIDAHIESYRDVILLAYPAYETPVQVP
jgi:hypothetical protein